MASVPVPLVWRHLAKRWNRGAGEGWCRGVRVRLDRKATSIWLLVVLGVREDGQKVVRQASVLSPPMLLIAGST
jgi:hypothetical protein